MCGGGGILGGLIGAALAPLTGGASLVWAAAGAGAGLVAEGMYNAAEAQRRQAQAAERSYQLQRQAQKTQANYTAWNNRMQRLAQIREARMRRAQAKSAAAASGADFTASSSPLAIGASLSTQTATNVGKGVTTDLFGNYLSGLNQQIGYQNYLFNQASLDQQSAMSMTNLGMSIFGSAAGSIKLPSNYSFSNTNIGRLFG